MAEFERRNLWQLTLPLFAFAFMSIGVAFADQVILSQYSEELAAAVSIANQILGIAYDVSGLFSVGALIMIAQCLGRDDLTQARELISIAVQASLSLCVALALILLVGAPYFVDWINTPPELRNDAIAYVRIVAGAILFNGVITTATAALKGFGRTLAILALGILANISYLFFEYSLVFGAFSFPELGVYGTASATLIVRLVSVAVLFVLLRRWFKFRLVIFQLAASRLSAMKQLAKISYPSVGEGMIYNFYQLGVVAFVSALGTEAVLTRSFSLTISSLLTIIGFVVAQGNEILVGYDRGAKENLRAQKRARKTALWAGLIAMIGGSLIYLNSDLFVGLFTEQENLMISIRQVLLIVIFLAPFQTYNQVIFASLKAVGDVNRPVILSLALTLLLALPGAYLVLAVWQLGVVGLWYVYLIHEAIRSVILWGLWESGSWQKYEVFKSNRN